MHNLLKSSLIRKSLLRLSLGLMALSVTGLPTAHAVQTADQTIRFTLDPSGAPKRLGYMPVPLKLTSVKPVGILKEPIYTGTVFYGKIHLGNGPQADTYVAIDMPDAGDYKIYVDVNHNGDLTDDGDGKWSAKREGQRAMYGLNHYVLRASYGNKTSETSSAQYGINLYQFVTSPALVQAQHSLAQQLKTLHIDVNSLDKADALASIDKDALQALPRIYMYRDAAAVGEITVAGAKHKAYLVENDTDALYSKPIDDNGKAIGTAPATRPVWLLIDTKDDGLFAAGSTIDARAPFKLDGKTYEADIAEDGTKLILKTTTRPAYAPKVPERPKLLATGVVAPEFTATATDGHTVHLADYKGKVVILDFWATWCGPCQASMPHIEKVYKAVKNKNIAVLGLCVWDTKDEYDKWIPAHKADYTFDFAFDPAARDTAKSIAANLYKVSGIPTTYIIDKEGKVVDSVVGYSGPTDKRVEEALKKAGVDLGAEAAQKN